MKLKPVGWWCEKCHIFRYRKTHIIEKRRALVWCNCVPNYYRQFRAHQRKHWKRVWVKGERQP